MKKYSIETSNDGIKWVHKGGFQEGVPSRFNNAPFDENIALQEAYAYKQFWDLRPSPPKYYRVIIEI